MITKTYALRADIIDATYIFKAGKAKVRAHFQGGVLDERRRRPATLTTQDQIAMVIIEGTPEFKGGLIYILSEANDGSDVRVAVKDKVAKNPKTKKEEKKETKKDYPDVTTIGQAVNILSDLGAEAADLLSNMSILETAARMGVTFPNLSLKDL